MEEYEINIGDKVKVLFPNGRVEVGTISEIKHNGWCDIDFGGGCISHDIPQDRIERLIPISEEEIRKMEEELDKAAQEWFRHTMSKEDAIKNLNPNEHKINLPLPEDAKWEAIGRGYASVLMEKQARIDRLERLIAWVYDGVCHERMATMPYDDDMETTMCQEIMEKVEKLMEKQ